jgi:SAM-dependent methyltransferase
VTAQISSNEAKFQTGNPVVRAMIDGFFRKLDGVVRPLRPSSVLDAGCGEGESIVRLGELLGPRITAVDIEERCIARTRERLPAVETAQADVTALPFADSCFDLVICLEVVEHVPSPERAIAELARVAARDVVISVPYEPWFRIGSLMRGKHVRSLGNHPEHVNHFNRASLRRLLDPHLDVRAVEVAFPWLIAAARVRV